ncbi:MAG: hypothetical protein K2X90_02580 [Candidatus Babeliaceae bacterium]|nr:hypothetical protein [Candidatus Babeliaceae bacterium]
MSLLIFYSAAVITGLATGKLQNAAFSRNKPVLLIVTLVIRLTLLLLAGLTIPLLHLSFVHFILSIILFLICNFLAVQTA